MAETSSILTRPNAAAAGLAARARRARQRAAELAPGLAAAGVGVAVSLLVHRLLPTVSPLMVAIVLGALLANVGLRLDALRPGLQVAARRLLRLGIVLLGLQLVVGQMLALGASVLVLTVAATVVTLLTVNWLGRRMGLSPGRSLLVAGGFAICGASAVAAVGAVADSEEEDVMTAVALVTLFGSLSILALPLLFGVTGLDESQFGIWAGASGPEVAQVIAIAGAVGSTALAPAVIVKLTRVMLLAPVILAIGLWQRRNGQHVTATRRPPLIPLFVAGFLAAVAARSLGLVPAGLLAPAKFVQTVLLAAAMFALGSAVRVMPLLRTGRSSFLLGAAALLVITVFSYVGLLIIG